MGCTQYISGHTTECINTLWKEAGCNDEGQLSPLKITSVNLAILQAMTLA